MFGLSILGVYSGSVASFIENLRVRRRFRSHRSRHGSTLNLTPQQGVFAAAFFLIIVGCVLFFINLSRKGSDGAMRKRCTEKTRAYVANNRSKKGVSKCVDFSVGEKDYFLKMNSRKPSNYEVGSSINIFYNPNKPTEFYIEGEKSAPISIPMLMASVVCIVGAGALIFAGIKMGS